MNEVDHSSFMAHALKLAEISRSLGEVPVGAIVVVNNEIVGAGFNRRELAHSCLAHAELTAIANASERLGRWRLIDAVVYSTLEPCIMCAGALVHARVKGLVYGVADPKFGAIESLYSVATDSRLNHQIKVVSGVRAEECLQLLVDFFRGLRIKKKT